MAPISETSVRHIRNNGQSNITTLLMLWAGGLFGAPCRSAAGKHLISRFLSLIIRGACRNFNENTPVLLS